MDGLISNDRLHQFTTELAVQLSKAIRNASFSFRPKNFDIDCFQYRFSEIFERWIEQGEQGWQLIESVDEFHLNQFGHATISNVI
jgi:hypothetical protein